jgi:hypothetical protein
MFLVTPSYELPGSTGIEDIYKTPRIFTLCIYGISRLRIWGKTKIASPMTGDSLLYFVTVLKG